MAVMKALGLYFWFVLTTPLFRSTAALAMFLFWIRIFNWKQLFCKKC